MKKMILHQLFESETSTYTYLLADAQSREAIIIDSTIDTVARDLRLINELELKLLYTLDTHVHADHITGASQLREITGAKIAISSASQAKGADVYLNDGDEIHFGSFTITAISTPGHTDSCMSFYDGTHVFTGDTLLIRGTGRTDFQQGNSHLLYNSIRKKLFALPDDTVVFPAHDYHGYTSSTILEEKKFNPRVRLENSEEEFVQIMTALKLDHPKRINESVPANMVCGNLSQLDKQG